MNVKLVTFHLVSRHSLDVGKSLLSCCYKLGSPLPHTSLILVFFIESLIMTELLLTDPIYWRTDTACWELNNYRKFR